MATDLASRIQEDHLTCHICFQPFTKPKALPCLHTFCEECLRDFITSRGFDSQGHFQCPICRKEIEIPATGVSGFQDNHLVQSLSHTVTGPEPPVTRTGPEMSQPDPNFRPTPAPRKSKIKLQPESETGGSSVDGTPQVSNPEQTQEGNPAPVQAPYRPTDPVAMQVPYSTPSAPYPHIPDPTQAPVIPPPIPQPPPWLPNPLPTTGIYPDLPPPYSPPPYPETQGRPRATSTGAIACSNGLVQQIGQYGNTVRDFQRPKGLAVGLNNEIIVSDLGGNRILVFDQQGQLQGCFKCDCIVHDLTVTPKGTILVAVNQSKSAIMREYTMSGRFVANHGNYYKFENPSGIALNSDGFSIVTCLDSCVMYIFTDQKKMSQKIGSKGSGIEHFLSPYHVAVNNKDQIFVSDCGNNCIKVFSKSGKFKMNIGREGSGPGELRAPLGVCTNVDGYIIVADSGNFRVQVFNQRGQYHCIPLENTHKIGVDVKPTNVAVTDHNNLVVLLSGAGFAEVRVYSFKSENGIYCSTCYTQ